MKETITLLIVYKGDVTPTLEASGSLCPFRLNGNGDTEQSVEVNRGLAAHGIPVDQFTSEAESFILDDARKNGRIKTHRWIIAEHTHKT